MEERAKRKLSAILSADVKGYSRLMEENELATVQTLEAYREMFAGTTRNYRGRVVDSPGDNVLAEFVSVVDAVECAVEIQKEIKEKNEDLPENRRMVFRIGINLGDVIEEGERIYGDGVNIAARIESLATGGGICISGTAFDQVEGKLGLEFEYLGEQSVKNIKKPVRVYRVRVEAGIFDVETSRELPLPEKPSIAVLAFANMSGDLEQEYFSDGLTEEIITALSKVPHLFVIARNSTFAYKGKPVNVKQVGQELGVRYVLEGSVRKAGDRVRITAQLIDATTGNHLWAERYDRELKDIFALQDEITMKILTALQVKLTEGEQARISVKGTDNLEAYLKFLQGREHSHRFTRGGNVFARQMCEEAIALDPEYAGPYWLLSIIHQSDLFLGVSTNRSQSMARIKELAQKALALDRSSANAHQALCFLYTMLRQYEKGIAEGERAVDLDPNSADNHSMLGMSFHFAGRYEQAISSLNKAIRLNPIPPTTYFLFLGNAYQLAGMYEESIVAYKKVLSRNPDHLFAHLRLAATYILIDREEEARTEASEVVRIDPKFSIEPFAETVPYKKQADLELLMSSLRKAGLK
jgi:adenylate cyclase